MMRRHVPFRSGNTEFDAFGMAGKWCCQFRLYVVWWRLDHK